MDFEEDILRPFLEDMVEMHRQEILKQEDSRELAEKQTELSQKVYEKLKEPYPELYELVSAYTDCIMDLSVIKQEQLYLHGVKDGIRLKNLIGRIEEGERC